MGRSVPLFMMVAAVVLIFWAAEVRFSRPPKLWTSNTTVKWAAACMRLPLNGVGAHLRGKACFGRCWVITEQDCSCLPGPSLLTSIAIMVRIRHKTAGYMQLSAQSLLYLSVSIFEVLDVRVEGVGCQCFGGPFRCVGKASGVRARKDSQEMRGSSRQAQEIG
jgi:hypothetical protein